MLYCIDATKRGDLTKDGLVWHFDKIRRIHLDSGDSRRVALLPGFQRLSALHRRENRQGEWQHDLFAAIWGSPLVVDGKVYLGDEDGDVVILQAGREKKLIAEVNMGSSVYSSPVPANGALFIMNRNQLFALAAPSGAAPPAQSKASNSQ